MRHKTIECWTPTPNIQIDTFTDRKASEQYTRKLTHFIDKASEDERTLINKELAIYERAIDRNKRALKALDEFLVIAQDQKEYLPRKLGKHFNAVANTKRKSKLRQRMLEIQKELQGMEDE